MTAKISDYKNVLNGIFPQTDFDASGRIKRIALAAVPFLSLHPSLRFPVSIIMGARRVWNTDHQDVSKMAVAVVALTSTIFRSQVGGFATIIQEIVTETGKLQKTVDCEDASKSIIKIFNNIFYLALMSRGGLELSMIALVIQMVNNLIQSRNEFKSDRWIEGVANLLMSGVRLQQFHTQYHQLRRNWDIETAIKKISVGELHEKWRFPSDHLPVGIEVNGIRIISWNVLNNAYMEWVTDKDSQGLNGSMISELNTPVTENGLTMRDIVVAEMVQSMMTQGQIVALQECSEPFLQHLKERLPSNWELVKSFDTQQIDQDVILYNKTQLTYQSTLSETTRSAYPSVPRRPLQNAYFSNHQGTDLRIINCHIPGDPNKPCREELARYVRDQHKEGPITVALGDNNFERDEMIAAYRKAGFSDFSLHSPWKTNIDPDTKQSKGIDHLFVAGDATSTDLKPTEVLPEGNLQETINLLNKPNA